MQLCHPLWLYIPNSWSKQFHKPKVCSQTAGIIENPGMYVDGVYPIKFKSVELLRARFRFKWQPIPLVSWLAWFYTGEEWYLQI